MAYGRAHVVVYKGGVNDFGFEVYRGVSPDCMHNDWGALAGNFTTLDCAGRTACIDSLTDADYDSDTSDGDYILVSGWNNATTCYETGANSRQWPQPLPLGHCPGLATPAKLDSASLSCV